ELIVEEIRLVGAAAGEGDLALERVCEREADAALNLRLERVRIDREPGIQRADHALDGEAVTDAREFDHLRDIALELAAAADIAIEGDAADSIGRRAPAGRLRGGIEHAPPHPAIGEH